MRTLSVLTRAPETQQPTKRMWEVKLLVGRQRQMVRCQLRRASHLASTSIATKVVSRRALLILPLLFCVGCARDGYIEGHPLLVEPIIKLRDSLTVNHCTEGTPGGSLETTTKDEREAGKVPYYYYESELNCDDKRPE